MTDYIALEAPVWLFLIACFALLIAGIAFGALAAYALRIAKALDRIDDYKELAAPRADVERALAELRVRLARLEAPEPIPVRTEPPPTVPDSIELDPDTDVYPCLPWHTHVAS